MKNCYILFFQGATYVYLFKMEVMNFEAEDKNTNNNDQSVVSDHEGQNFDDESSQDFIDNSQKEDQSLSFFYRFVKQTCDPAVAVNNDSGHFLTCVICSLRCFDLLTESTMNLTNLITTKNEQKN